MKPTHFFLEVIHTYKYKNKLQAEFADYLHSLHSKLILSSGLDVIQSVIIQVAEKINSKHKRCKPLNISFRQPYPGKLNFALDGFDEVVFYIKEANCHGGL